MGVSLDLLSAGAAKGLVTALAADFRAETGADIAGTFSAVGAIRDQLLHGAPCDAIILTAALIAELERAGRVVPGTAMPLGRVRTGLAVRAGEPLPAIGDRAALRACLVAARAIWLPDPERATAGIHFVKVLRALGIHDAVAARLRPFPNGATAMRTMADEGEPGSVGCTQVTEILYTPGVALAGPLPAEFELATVYSVAVASGARDPALARRFTALVAGEASRGLRAAGGFED